MPSATIIEQIEPNVLLVPDDTGLSIATAAMPNGDNLLQIDPTAPTKVAYMNAVEGRHYVSNTGSPFSLSFWIKPDASRVSGVGSTTINTTEMVMAVTNTTVNGVTGGAFNNTSTAGRRWSLAFVDATSLGLCFHRANNSSSANDAVAITLLPNVAQMVTIVHTGSAIKAVRNENVMFNGTVWAASSPAAASGLQFAIGNPSSGTNQGRASGTNLLGKIAMFDFALSDAQISDLYNSAVYGP